jgi:hypothetical protein
MVWIKSKKNGNSFEVTDVDLAAQLLKEGHEGFQSDPRAKGGAEKWDPEAEPEVEPQS